MITTIVSALMLQTTASFCIPGVSPASEAQLLKTMFALATKDTGLAILCKSRLESIGGVDRRFTSFANRISNTMIGLPSSGRWQSYVSANVYKDQKGDTYLVPVAYQNFKKDNISGTIYVTSFGVQIVIEGVGSPVEASYLEQHEFAISVLRSHTNWRLDPDTEKLYEPPQSIEVRPVAGMKGNGVGIVAKPNDAKKLEPDWRHLISFWIGRNVTILDIPYSGWLDARFGKGSFDSLLSEPNSKLTALSDRLWERREAKNSGGGW